MSLSVIIPVYNEVRTINEIIKKILEVNIQFNEIIIVDDYSNDGTYEKLSSLRITSYLKLLDIKKIWARVLVLFQQYLFD